MNKRGLIKYIFILISAFISLYFMNTSNIGFSGSFLNLPMLFTFLIALTIFMFYKKNKIKKNKFVYDVILLLLMIFSAICFALFYSQVRLIVLLLIWLFLNYISIFILYFLFGLFSS